MASPLDTSAQDELREVGAARAHARDTGSKDGNRPQDGPGDGDGLVRVDEGGAGGHFDGDAGP
eukprot:15358417-Alexandrium_andersonii.AAC.1